MENTKKEFKTSAIIWSLFLFPVGLSLYIRWVNDDSPEKRKLGKQCLIASLIPYLLFVFHSFIFY